MQKFNLPHVILPLELCSLLKTNLAVSNSSSIIHDSINSNEALYHILEKIFKEFDDGRGFEKTVMGLGWPNFRDRIASIYLYRLINRKFPQKTDYFFWDFI